MFSIEKFESDEEFSVETERDLWEGYEQWLDNAAERHFYELAVEM